MAKKQILSVILPVYQGEQLVAEALYSLIDMGKQLPIDWRLEIIAVDDGSTDSSYSRIKSIQQQYPDIICAVRLTKNNGSIIALRAALEHSNGDLVTFTSQDMQEPPEMLLMLFESWQQHGGRVHVAHRVQRHENFLYKAPSIVYHYLFKKFIMPGYPSGGVATMLIDKTVVNQLNKNNQRHVDLATEILSFGYHQRLLPVARHSGGKSGQTWTKRIKLALDNVISFSYISIRLMSMFGIIIAFLGFVFMLYVLIGKATGWYPINQPPGWATLVIIISMFSGMIMLMLGTIGEYLWRILEYSRQRQLYYIEEVIERRKQEGDDDK